MSTFCEDCGTEHTCDDFPLRSEGFLRDRYNIYLEQTDEVFPKTFDEWLES